MTIPFQYLQNKKTKEILSCGYTDLSAQKFSENEYELIIGELPENAIFEEFKQPISPVFIETGDQFYKELITSFREEFFEDDSLFQEVLALKKNEDFVDLIGLFKDSEIIKKTIDDMLPKLSILIEKYGLLINNKEKLIKRILLLKERVRD